MKPFYSGIARFSDFEILLANEIKSNLKFTVSQNQQLLPPFIVMAVVFYRKYLQRILLTGETCL